MPLNLGGICLYNWQLTGKLFPAKKKAAKNLTIARNFLTTTIIKNTKFAGITAAAGTRLTQILIRLVINSIINYPKSPPKVEISDNPQNKE